MGKQVHHNVRASHLELGRELGSTFCLFVLVLGVTFIHRACMRCSDLKQNGEGNEEQSSNTFTTSCHATPCGVDLYAPLRAKRSGGRIREIEPIQAELQVGAMTNRARTPTQRRRPRFAGGAILRARLMEGPIERDLKRNYGSNAACGCVQPTSSMQSRFRRARIGSAPWGTMKALIVGLESEEGRGGLELGGEGEKKQFGSPRSEGESNAFQG